MFVLKKIGTVTWCLDDDLKNTIRNFEKQKKQIISAQYGTLFNQTYIYIIYINQFQGWAGEACCIIFYFSFIIHINGKNKRT